MPIDWGIIVLLFFESLNYLLITLLIFYWLEKTQVAMNLFCRTRKSIWANSY